VTSWSSIKRPCPNSCGINSTLARSVGILGVLIAGLLLVGFPITLRFMARKRYSDLRLIWIVMAWLVYSWWGIVPYVMNHEFG
jgi:hypothetical protein